jgi:phage I-like protein
MSIKDEPWFSDPFSWYEEQGHPEIVGIAITDKVALDFLQALYQIYKRLERNDRTKAMEDAKQLAILLLASAFDYAEEAIDELIIQEVSAVDIDAAFAEMIEEQND